MTGDTAIWFHGRYMHFDSVLKIKKSNVNLILCRILQILRKVLAKMAMLFLKPTLQLMRPMESSVCVCVCVHVCVCVLCMHVLCIFMSMQLYCLVGIHGSTLAMLALRIKGPLATWIHFYRPSTAPTNWERLVVCPLLCEDIRTSQKILHLQCILSNRMW